MTSSQEDDETKERGAEVVMKEDEGTTERGDEMTTSREDEGTRGRGDDKSEDGYQKIGVYL